MRKFSAKVVPRILADDQKQRRLHNSSNLLHNAQMFDIVIPGDETWCFQYDPKTRWQRKQSKTQSSTRPRKDTHVSLAAQDHTCVFLRSEGIVHYEFIAQGRTVNLQYYFEVMTRLRESIRRKRPELRPDNWVHQKDNASAYDALRDGDFLAKRSII
jgi:hypothetical protein